MKRACPDAECVGSSDNHFHAKEKRHSGSGGATSANKVHWAQNVLTGHHLCCLFDETPTLYRSLAEFVIKALNSNTKVAVICLDDELAQAVKTAKPDYEPQPRSAVESALRLFGVDVEQECLSGRLEFCRTSDTYLQDGRFDHVRMCTSFLQMVDDAIAQGYSALHAIGDMSWCLAPNYPNVEMLIEYETNISHLIKNTPKFAGFCYYDRRIFTPEFLLQVLAAHPQAAVNDELFLRNFYFVPPETSAFSPSQSMLSHWVQNLRERQILEQALENRTVELQLKNIELQREIEAKARVEHERELATLAAKQKTTFVSTLSHEIRTPLNGIIAACTLLTSASLSGEMKDCTNVIQISCSHLQMVVNNVLEFSAMESGSVTVENEPFSVREAAECVVQMLQVSEPGREKNFVCRVADDVPSTVIGDRKKIAQVLVNLVSNAAKFTRPSDRIELAVNVVSTLHQPRQTNQVIVPTSAPSLTRSGNVIVLGSGSSPQAIRWNTTQQTSRPEEIYLQFSVLDNGMGVRPEKLARLGEPFYQADQSTTRKFGGVGLGLAICKRYIDQLRGQLAVQSDGENCGTNVTFTIPLRKATDSTPAAVVVELSKKEPPPPLVIPSSLSSSSIVPTVNFQEISKNIKPNLKVLLVEDNVLNTKIMMHLLGKMPVQATAVSDGMSAVSAVRDSDFDVILMDLHMPGELDGIEATRVIRSLCSGRAHSPTIYALTASVGEQVKKQCLQAGMNGYLSKPLKLKELISALTNSG